MMGRAIVKRQRLKNSLKNPNVPGNEAGVTGNKKPVRTSEENRKCYSLD
ncbi:MAG: hypothetical protein IPI10_14705 [Bacteroidetes bacterium]|nr:hypothetical protein [Bacteroidota bacterium]